MGQKVHPLGFRLGITQPHLSQWYASKKNYSKYILEDHFLRTILPKQYAKAGFEKIEISRKIEDHIEIVIRAQKPEILIGKKGENLKNFQKEIKKLIFKYRGFSSNKSRDVQSKQKLKVILYVIRCQTGASSIADFLVENLEKRIPYKIVFVLLKKHLKKIRQREIALRSSAFVRAEPSTNSSPGLGVPGEEDRTVNGALDSALPSAQPRESTTARTLPREATGPTQSPAGLLEAEGMKIQISGRLNGAEIARQEWIREGRLPLQTLQAKIDYSFKQAYTIYGILGVKVWVFKNIDNVTTKTYKI
nr:30S ribosomal protein S3 [Halimeda borneensis]